MMTGTNPGDRPTPLMTGVPALDRQHEFLERLLSEFSTELAYGFASSKVDEFLTDLLLYSSYHFATEEATMKSSRYRGFIRHKREHDQFRARVQAFAATDNHGRTNPAEIARFVKAWLERHTHQSDLVFAATLRPPHDS